MGLFGGGIEQITQQVEQSLSEKLGEDVKVLSSGTLGGGCINNASKLETTKGNFFLKWNSDSEKNMFLREAESLQELRIAAKSELVVPEVFAAKEIDETPGFLVLEMLDSDSPSSDTDEILGRGLATIHLHAAEKFGFHNNNYCGSTLQDNSWKKSWVEFFRDNRLRFLLNLIQQERPLSSSKTKVYDKLLEKIPVLIPDDSEPVLIHGDLWSGNYMLTSNGPALIDPASYYANREMEMGIMTMFGGFSQQFYSAYNEVNPLPAEWRDRNRLYQLYHVLNHYYLFGGGYGQQALSIARSYI